MTADSQPAGKRIRAAGQGAAVNIRNRRRACGLSVRELSARLAAAGHPILPSGISKLEHHDRVITVDDLSALAAALDVADPWTLVTGAWCSACKGAPPAGFTCNKCGVSAGAESVPEPEVTR